MILDLGVFVDETLDIKMADGMILHIPKASQAMVIEILKAKNVDENTPKADADRVMDNLVFMILNSNLDGVSMDRKSCAALSERMKVAILEAYTAFIRKTQSNPT